MKVEFCFVESDDVVFTKESRDLKDIINVITKVGTEINLSFSKDDFIHGYVQSVMYQVDAENNDESLRIYFSNDYKKSKIKERISAEHLSTTKINEKNDIS
ncbi:MULTISPECIES: hypothetical protein [Clostridium]|uniref:Uncharacterized protein n=1 Tax=Clostridium saccharoperbutylacetonicum N1-4(HMT) TaxID=931276 RepID=M1MP39_9CLOT|nr:MULTISPECIES: hypothetical protein [Clostridium]AGF57983.1 hypothetical protein Cspa_c42300 [Clostridium saccharoperbutylacetonicum N1-4(HMT)]AQR96663.1 hypothetical protein CLSAP_39870 [Clostridium saccharoperbutylacetonicum]NRT61244.1 hypothetical protein [Clostridium saccharoperbutylacetonicum]NSB24561.1 hypothetical protein [Clostridium saccharoperbutylacetonicum]NSB32539.1 hypothetical protein [Clostridium saccharoperbutylacetonicum]